MSSFALPSINSALSIYTGFINISESEPNREGPASAISSASLFQLHIFSWSPPLSLPLLPLSLPLSSGVELSLNVLKIVTLFPRTMEQGAFALAIIHWQNGFSLRANSVTAYTVTSRQFSLYSFPLLSPSHLVLLIASLAVDSSAIFCSRDHSDECSPLAMKRPLELRGEEKRSEIIRMCKV